MRTIEDDVDALGRALGTILREQEGEDFYELEERLRLDSKTRRERSEDTAPLQAQIEALSLHDAERIVRAFSTYFQLINLAEEHERLRSLEKSEGPRKQGLEEALRFLQSEGHDAESARALIAGVDFGLTFTAHPTELRRRTVRGHLEAIARALPQLDQAEQEARILAHVEALWQTLELRAVSPTVHDEVNAGLAYVQVIAQVLPTLERDLNVAFERVYGKAAALRLPLSFHSWMGGDRDGNPAVTAEVTAETFAAHAGRARGQLLERVDEAYALLSQHHLRLHRASLEQPSSRDGHERGNTPEEPFRAELAAMHRKLADASTPFDVVSAAQALVQAVRDENQGRSAAQFAEPIAVGARAFGLHLASLDIREHSSQVGAAVGELLELGGIVDAKHYTEADEQEKQRILLAELGTRRPLAPVGHALSDAVRTVIEPVRAAGEAMRASGPAAFGRYVVSMSEAPSDILEVLLVAREVGVSVRPVPLFETLHDLQSAPEVMAALLEMSVYRQAHGDDAVEIMIGYSDSNKDAGFFAANWALYEAQRKVAAVCRKAGVRHRFFHGRGTSIGRGGGPTARALGAQPAGTLGAGIRITEQGEALGVKYSQPDLAYRNLEQSFYGLMVAAGRREKPLPEAWSDAMHRASKASVTAYRRLVDDPGFLPFFEAITPLGEIARLKMASRPVRRPGAASLSNLRAIPWVMSWTQCRANVPGWFGLEAALREVGEELGRELYQQWPFFQATIDNAQMSLAKLDLAIFRAYRMLSDDDRLGKLLEEAFTRTVAAVEAITQAPLLANAPRLARSISVRNPYIEPIHRVQIELLTQVRALPSDAELDPTLERALLLSLQGVAAGMRNTG